MHPHDAPPQLRFIHHNPNHPPPNPTVNSVPPADPSQPFHPQSHRPPQDAGFSHYPHTSNYAPRDKHRVAAPASQISAFQTSGPPGQFVRQRDDQRPYQPVRQHPQHYDANAYYVSNNPVPQVPVRHILVHQSSHTSSSTQQPASASSSASPTDRGSSHTVSPPEQTKALPNYASEQMNHHQREELYLRAIAATHKNIADLLSVIQREQVNLRDRLALQEHSRETSAVHEEEFRSTIISSFQSLQGRLDRIENAIGKEPELPPGSKAVGTDKSLKDRLRSTEGMILEIVDKTNAEILRSRNPRPVTRVIPPTPPPPPPPPPPLRVEVGIQACPVMANAAVDVRPSHGLEVSVQTMPIEVAAPPVLIARSELAMQVGRSDSPLYHSGPPRPAPGFQMPPVISRFPSSPLTRDTMRPAEWSREGSQIDGDISPRLSTPRTPSRSVRMSLPVTPSPASRRRTIATQTPSRPAAIEAAHTSNVSISSTLIQAEPFSPSQFIRSPSPVHRTTTNPNNSARTAILRREMFGEITTESMLQGPLPPQFAEPARYVNSSSSESETSTQNGSPAQPPPAPLEPEAPAVYLNDPEPAQTDWAADLFGEPTLAVEHKPLPILSPLPAPSPLPASSPPPSPPPIIGRKRSRSRSRTHSLSSLSSLSDSSHGHQTNRPRIVSEEPSIVSSATPPVSQVGKLRKRQRERSSQPTRKRQGRKSQNETKPLSPVIPTLEVFDPDVGCEWPDFVEDVEAGMSVQCSGCNSWYHLACAGITENDECLKPENDFFCPPCEKTREIHGTSLSLVIRTHMCMTNTTNLLPGRTRTLESVDDSQCARPDCPHPALADAGAEIFTVEYIIGRQPHHGTDDTEFLWLVKWEGYNVSDASWIRPDAFSNGTPDHMVPIFEQRAKEEGHDPSNYGPTILLQEALDWGWR
ncbi:hypothetical protein QCA50_019687 [Cerrena zonata]|uniref:Chromo domain-containing protein n=1 Tax=Cerrena zonata TaxID=2478898 RepID=A0AAW0FDT5_9APHY